MLTLRADSATRIDPNNVLVLDDLPISIRLSTYDPADAFVGIYWDVPSFSGNIKLQSRISWSTPAAPNTFFMVFGAANNNDPRTASDSVFIEMGCNGDGYIVFRLAKRISGTLTTTTHTTTNLWSDALISVLFGINSITQELTVITNTTQDPEYQQKFTLAIPTYSYTRVYEFASTASATSAITELRLRGTLSINTGFVFNKNKTTTGNMVDFIKQRTGLDFTAADVVFSNIRGPAPGDIINNTRIDITGSGNGILTGNYTLSYKRVPIYQIYPLASKYEDLYLAEPFTSQSIIEAYNLQYGMNLSTDDVLLTPSSGTSFNEWDTLTITVSSTNPCLEGTIYITLYHPV